MPRDTLFYYIRKAVLIPRGVPEDVADRMRKYKGRPKGVLAATTDDQGNLTFGFSFCHTSPIYRSRDADQSDPDLAAELDCMRGDSFNKVIGRNIALARAEKYRDAGLQYIDNHWHLVRGEKKLAVPEAVLKALPRFIARSQRFFSDKKTDTRWVSGLRVEIDAAVAATEAYHAANTKAPEEDSDGGTADIGKVVSDAAAVAKRE